MGENMKSYVFDIQRFCVKDGPGIRTTVFLKGCPLNCVWCHNPESKKKQPELSFDESKCIDCGECSKACKHGAILKSGQIDRSKCTICGDCVSSCVGALEILGKNSEAQEVIKNVLLDKSFYDNSGGGLTLSGGEPLYSIELTTQLLKAAKEHGIHTCLETCGFARWEDLESISDYVDLFLFDIKETDKELHKVYTGVDNELILQNLFKLNKMGAKIVLRCPIIPRYNDREEHFKNIAELANRLENVLYIDVLPYHPLGKSKSKLIGEEYQVDGTFPSKEQVQDFVKMISAYTDKKVNRL